MAATPSEASVRWFEMHHVVGFEETNVVGNVYYANHVLWQGRCRELFLREYVPEILEEFERGLALVTVKVGCEYFGELEAFDELCVRMGLAELSPSRMTLRFEYWRTAGRKGALPGEGELVARGEQQLACMRRTGGKPDPEPWPEALREALRGFEEA